jgi:Tfp pilus assembly protein FimT
VELFIALAIVGILVGFALPGFSNMLLEARMDSGVDKLTRAISLSRNLSLNNTGDQRVVICPSTNPEADEPTCADASETSYHTGWLVFIDCDNDQILDSTATVDCDLDGAVETGVGVDDDKDRVLRVQSAFDRLEIESTSTDRIVFRRNGRADNAITFNVGSDGTTYAEISMNPLGNLSIVPNHDFF